MKSPVERANASCFSANVLLNESEERRGKCAIRTPNETNELLDDNDVVIKLPRWETCVNEEAKNIGVLSYLWVIVKIDTKGGKYEKKNASHNRINL